MVNWKKPVGEAPLCACGCGEKVKQYKNRWNTYIKGHQLRSESYNERVNAERPLCKCGCKEFVGWNKYGNKWNTYIKGHEGRNRKWSEEVKKKISKAHMGKEVSEETKTKIALAVTGKKQSKSSREKMYRSHKKWFKEHPNEHPMLGKTHSDEAKEKISVASIALWEDEVYRKCMSDLMKERYKDPNERLKISIASQGIKKSKETRKRMSESAKERFKNPEDHPAWRGGLSCEPYCRIFSSDEFKDMIRERDSWECQNPDCWKNKYKGKPHVHHINYIKKDCELINLITLCRSCNTRANSNRDNWQEFYTNIMKEKFEDDGLTIKNN